jgi:hypothetical protein
MEIHRPHAQAIQRNDHVADSARIETGDLSATNTFRAGYAA